MKDTEYQQQVKEGLMSYLSDTNWHTFAMSGDIKSRRRLDVQIGGMMLRITIGKEIVYEGFDADRALAFYNGLN